MPHANNTDCGLRARDGPTMRYAFFVWGMALSDLASPAEASSLTGGAAQGFAQAGNRFPLFGIMR
jgi:hypothetical protein